MLGIHHAAVGIILGLVFLVLTWIGGHHSVGFLCLAFAFFGSLLPDWLDPPGPGNFLHRSVGHNFVSLFLFAGVFVMSLVVTYIFDKLDWWLLEDLTLVVAAFSAGFLSHLIMDAMTPMGLPMFVGRSIFGLLQIPLYMVPFVNFIMFVITIYLAYRSIKHLAKKIGGIPAMFLLFIPIWSPLLVIGATLWDNGSILGVIGHVLIGLFVVCALLLVKMGKSWNRNLKQSA